MCGAFEKQCQIDLSLLATRSSEFQPVPFKKKHLTDSLHYLVTRIRECSANTRLIFKLFVIFLVGKIFIPRLNSPSIGEFNELNSCNLNFF